MPTSNDTPYGRCAVGETLSTASCRSNFGAGTMSFSRQKLAQKQKEN